MPAEDQPLALATGAKALREQHLGKLQRRVRAVACARILIQGPALRHCVTNRRLKFAPMLPGRKWVEAGAN
jgi:hypothetical protein